MATPLYRTRFCFGCGTDNPGGLGLAPVNDGGRILARFTPRDEHRGYARAVHGGITCTLLDEVVGLACSQRVDAKCVTVEVCVQLKRPVLVGAELTVEGRYVRRQGRYLVGAGRILDGGGRVLATARVKAVQLTDEQLAKFVEK